MIYPSRHPGGLAVPSEGDRLLTSSKRRQRNVGAIVAHAMDS